MSPLPSWERARERGRLIMNDNIFCVNFNQTAFFVFIALNLANFAPPSLPPLSHKEGVAKGVLRRVKTFARIPPSLLRNQ